MTYTKNTLVKIVRFTEITKDYKILLKSTIINT